MVERWAARRPRRATAALAGIVAMLVVLVGAGSAPGASAGTAWSRPARILAGPIHGAWAAIGGDGSVHVAATGDGLRYGTNRTGRWVWTRITRPPAGMPSWEDGEPSLALDAAGKAYIAFSRAELTGDTGGSTSLGIYVASNVTGSWRVRRLSTDSGDWYPSLRVVNGKSHVVWARDDSGLYYGTDVTGSWRTSRIIHDPRVTSCCPGASYSGTSLRMDGGRLHIAYSISEPYYPNPGVHYWTNASGTWRKTRVTTSDSDVSPALVLGEGGVPHIAFERYTPTN